MIPSFYMIKSVADRVGKEIPAGRKAEENV